MRVLQISQIHHILGGSDRVFFETSALLERSGHEVAKFCANHSDNEPSPWQPYFPRAADFDRARAADLCRYLYNPAAAQQLGRLCDDFQPEVAHLHITYGKLTPSILRPLRQRGIRIVQTCHEWRTVSPNYALTRHGQPDTSTVGLARAWRGVPQRFNRGSLARSALATTEWYLGRALGSLRHMDHLIAISDFQKHFLIANGVAESKISTLYNFTLPIELETHGQAKSQPQEAPIDLPSRYALYFGRLDPVKGLDLLIDAVADLEDVTVVIAGEGEQLDDLKQQAAPLGNRVRFVGFQSGFALDQLIRQASMTVLPARWNEPFGLTVIESMMRSVPVIGTSMGALPELIDDPETGRIVPAEDVSALATAIDELWRDPQKVRAMGARGHAIVRDRFSPERHLEGLLAIYAGSVGKERRR